MGGKPVIYTSKAGDKRELTGAIMFRGYDLAAPASSPPEQTTKNEEMRRLNQIIISWDVDILGRRAQKSNQFNHFNSSLNHKFHKPIFDGILAPFLIMFTPYVHLLMLD